MFITGVAGFIGSRLAQRLLKEDIEVVGLDAFTDYYDPAIKRVNVARMQGLPGFRLLEADLLDDGWQHELRGVEVVFHQAAQPGVRASWAEGFAGYAHNNVIATQRLLEAVAELQVDIGKIERNAEGLRPLRRFVYASSSSVYGDAMTFPTTEDSIPRPHSPYGVTKLAAEHLCAVYARNWGIPTVSLRYFTVYGGGQRPDMALNRMIAAALGGPAFPLFGDGKQRRDFTHVDDIVAANLAAASTALEPGEVINLSGGSDATVYDLLELVADAVGSEVPVCHHAAQAGDVRRTGGDTAKARAMLNWVPRVALADGIAEQVARQRHGG